jgi:hypothetical protein
LCCLLSTGKLVINNEIPFLLDNDENASGPKHPIFRTGMDRSFSVSRGSIDKAGAVREGQAISNEGWLILNISYRVQ